MREQPASSEFSLGEDPINLSRRRFLLASGSVAGALVLGIGLPSGQARAQAAQQPLPPGTRVPAFLEIRPDSSVRFLSPFIEGGQGIFTAMAQIVGEELDADPATFVVENAPAGDEYKVMDSGMRITGGSQSVRTSYTTMRRLGALARHMLLQAAASALAVPLASLRTEPGKVVHDASGQTLTYGELAPRARDLQVPPADAVSLKDPAQFRWIGKPVKRLDAWEKSTGQAVYTIDCRVDDMLHAAVQHAPRFGMTPGAWRNEAQVRAMKGVHSVHRLPDAVAVVAERWWQAKRAVEALQVEWLAPADAELMPPDFSSDDFARTLANEPGDGQEAEVKGDLAAGMSAAKTTLSATYHSQYLNHAQLEPPSALARFNDDGTLELWIPNQAPEMFQGEVAKRTGLDASKILIHSPLLGGFFGRHFVMTGRWPGRRRLSWRRRSAVRLS